MAVQIAKLFGARQVIAAASSEDKLEVAKKLGADVAIDRWQIRLGAKGLGDATGGKGVDLVLESVGGAIFEQALSDAGAFRPPGRHRVGEQPAEQRSHRARSSTTTARSSASEFISIIRSRPDSGHHQGTSRLCCRRAGLILQPDHVLPLSEAATAHRLVEERKSTGKVVPLPW